MRIVTCLIFPLALALAACSEDGSPTGGEGGDGTAVEGIYTGTFSVTLSGIRVDCPGSVTITNQSGASFSGTLSVGVCGEFITDPLPPVPISGTVDQNGQTTFSFSSGDIEELLGDLQDCEIVRIDDGFVGVFAGNNLTATLSGDLNCAGIGQIAVALSVNANR